MRTRNKLRSMSRGETALSSGGRHYSSRGPGEFWSAYEQQLRETMMFGEGEGEENVKSFALTTSLLHLRTWASPTLALWCSFQGLKILHYLQTSVGILFVPRVCS